MGKFTDFIQKVRRKLSRSSEDEVKSEERNSDIYGDQPAYSDRPEDQKVEVGHSYLKQPSYSDRGSETPITSQTAATNYASMPTKPPVTQRASAKSNAAPSIDGVQQSHYVNMPSPAGLADQLPSVPTTMPEIKKTMQYVKLPAETGLQGAPALPTTQAPKAPKKHHDQLPSPPIVEKDDAESHQYGQVPKKRLPAGIIPKTKPEPKPTTAEIAEAGPVVGRGTNNEIK